MKSHLIIIFSLVLISTINNLQASSINDKKGFSITPEAISQNSMVLKNGESFEFKGNVCVVKWSGLGNEKCLKVPSSKPTFKAYYPDSLHDVTDRLVVSQSNDKKSWNYRFKADDLKDIDLNQFTLTIGSNSKRGDDLLKIKAKLEKKNSDLARLRFELPWKTSLS